MKMKWFIGLLCMGSLSVSAQKMYQLESPDKKLQTIVTVGDNISFSMMHEGTEVLAASPISMTLEGGVILGEKPRVSKVDRKTVNKSISSPFYKKTEVQDVYNEMTLAFRGKYGLIFRMYNDGLAYRFTTKMKDSIVVVNENSSYNFSSDHYAFAPYVNNTKKTFEGQFKNSFERPYVHELITKLNSKRLMILPLLIELDGGKKLCITEADLEDYAGMFINNVTDQPTLKSVFAPYPKREEQGGDGNLQMVVLDRENYVAKTKGTRSFPWRVFVVSTEDRQLADCDMVYRLASPCRVKDLSWIKPGKVAWEWWHDHNLYNVDFKSGFNTDTYKYYIDFAAEKGIEYIIMDGGWSVDPANDLMRIVPDINLKELIEYGHAKNVGIILWTGFHAFEANMEQVVKHYSEMGIKGFKVDFMDRDDQKMINFLYRAAETCARYRMMVDFHGVCKPTGLQRTYPNVVNYEGVFGMEQLKWTDKTHDMPKYDVTIPFIRMIAGPMDYTQGAMRNATRGNFFPNSSEPMSQGTRCHQLALYVVLESPLNMLCDNPVDYRREAECTNFIADIPTVWDKTVALDGKVGEYVAIARQHGNEWYVGALTNWDARELTLDLSFLGEGNYTLELFKDGINADRAARDYKKEVISVPADRKVTIKMAPGGGWAAKIYK